MIILIQCGIADRDHKNSLRQYAHTLHYRNTICIAGVWAKLPIDYQMGVIAHEVGHLLAGNVEHSEEEADSLANKFFHIRIRYKNGVYGKHLQWLSLNDIMNVWEWSNSNIAMY